MTVAPFFSSTHLFYIFLSNSTISILFSDPCVPSPCNSNEECVNKIFDEYECKDPCDPNPCQNGGGCVGDTMGNYTCNCGNYSGTNCEIGELNNQVSIRNRWRKYKNYSNNVD